MPSRSLYVLPFLTGVVVLLLGQASSHYIRAPCVFRAEEADMHKYAAILAATEPYKASCMRQIMQSVNPIWRLALWAGGSGSVMRKATALRNRVDGVDAALSRYEDRLSGALRAYGLEFEDFNEISQEASRDNDLRRKLSSQAYYYKIAADLHSNLNNGLSTLPPIQRPSLLQSATRFVQAQLVPAEAAWESEVQLLSPIQRFARSVATIEAERVAMKAQLMEELHLPTLPAGINDPALQPAFCPQIRRALTALPRFAQAVVARHGLEVEEFEELQRKLQRNAWFRMQVGRELRALERQNAT